MPDLKQDLQALADRRSAESTTDFDAVLTTVTARRRRRTAVFSAAAAVVAVVAVVAVTPWNQAETNPAPVTSEGPRIDPSRPNLVTVTPATARPGATLALTFPESSGRGVAFQLAKQSEPAKVLYYLISDRGTGSEPKGSPVWWAAGDGSGRGWVFVGVSGPGPDHVVVPDTAEDGTYLLCAAKPGEQVCGLLTVRR